MVLIANSMSLRLAIPVDKIIGLPLDAIYLIKGISVISNEAILYIGLLIFSRKSTAVLSNGEEKHISPSSCAILYNSSCHSHGV